MIHVLVVDDHAIVRKGLKSILADTPDLSVCGEAASAQEALQCIQQRVCDIVLLDIDLPDQNGLEVLKQVLALQPTARVLMLSVHAEAQYAVRALRAGAAGYLPKDSAPEELVGAIRRVMSGAAYLTAAAAAALAQEVRAGHTGPKHAALSDRELEVLRRLAAGETPTQIGEHLGLSVKTISTYRARLLEKLQLETTAQLIRYAVDHGLTA